MEDEDIKLLIEDNDPIICQKSLLIANSFYFEDHLTGDWEGKDQNSFKLKNVNYPAVAIIVQILQKESYVIEEQKYLLDVLIEASKYQFPKIVDFTRSEILSSLSPLNCLEIWFRLKPYYKNDSSVRGLYLKAKYMSLDEFVTICQNRTLYQLTLENLRLYLGQVNLKTDSELKVFDAAMSWLRETSHVMSRAEVLFNLLQCLDFNSFTRQDIQKQLMTVIEIKTNCRICSVLNCCIEMKEGQPAAETYLDEVKEQAKVLMASKKRVPRKGICILAEQINEVPTNVHKTGSSCLLYYDDVLKKFTKLVDIDDSIITNLDGFGLHACKESIFLFGGMEGSERFNTCCWQYDTFLYMWTLKSRIEPLAYFESCVVKNKIHVIQRSLKNSWAHQYDPITDKWSKKLGFAGTSNLVRSCNFSDRCLVFDIGQDRAFLFDENNSQFDNINVSISQILPQNANQIDCFQYKGSFYIKSKKMIKIDRLQHDEFKQVGRYNTPNLFNANWKQIIEVVICNNILYTLCQIEKDHNIMRPYSKKPDKICYTPKIANKYKYCLEVCNMDTIEGGITTYIIFSEISDKKGLEIDGVKYTVAPALKIFSFDRFDYDDDQLVIDIARN